MVNYLDSKRIMGTSTERTGTDAVSGGWVELGRTTLGSSGENITVSSLADKRYYMVLYNGFMTGGTVNTFYRLGDGSVDSGSNYAGRNERNGGADGTNTSSTYLMNNQSATSADEFGVSYISNLSGKEKLAITHLVNYGSTGAANAPNRLDRADKWTYTSGAMDTFNAFANDTGSFNTGSEVVVLGWDSADTHTNNFWEELASVELGSAGDNLSSGTFTAKKYLWVQIFAKDNGSAIDLSATFNSDTGSNYAVRRSLNGAADGTFGNLTNMSWFGDNQAYNQFANVFIINNASNEKLCICHWVGQGTAGAGNAPARSERVTKWANTSNQITEIDIDNTSAGSFDTGSIIKVWGAD